MLAKLLWGAQPPNYLRQEWAALFQPKGHMGNLRGPYAGGGRFQKKRGWSHRCDSHLYTIRGRGFCMRLHPRHISWSSIQIRKRHNHSSTLQPGKALEGRGGQCRCEAWANRVWIRKGHGPERILKVKQRGLEDLFQSLNLALGSEVLLSWIRAKQNGTWGICSQISIFS